MRLDRFTLINVFVEGFSGDDVATPDSDCFQFAVMNCLLDGGTLTGAILGG